MEVRDLTGDDLDETVHLAKTMHAESRFSKAPMNEDVVRGRLGNLFDHPDCYSRVATHEGEICAAMLGAISPHLFLDVSIATESHLYAPPSKRGSFAAKKLVFDFEEWAKGRGAAYSLCELSAGINDDRAVQLFSRFGYEPSGSLVIKEF
jgi:hypothetical protein